MHKNWYLVAAGFGILGTVAVAMHHELGWTILGMMSVWCNIYNYCSDENEKL